MLLKPDCLQRKKQLKKRSEGMSWKQAVKDYGGGDLAFLSVDGEVIRFIVVGEPVLLHGKFKGRPSEKVGAPVVTDDGFQLFIIGKRLFRKLAKFEDMFQTHAFMAIRHGEQGDIESTYELKVVDDKDYVQHLFDIKAADFKPEMVDEAIAAAQSVMST
ncbi:hypothetical protein ES703_81667 [subsurface metagenome]